MTFDGPGAGRTGQGEVRTLAGERWLIALTEPLIPLRARAAAEQSIAEMFDSDRVWAVGFTSLLLHSMLVSLPADDPRRSVRFAVPGGPAWNAPGDTEGGWLADGREFGGIEDATDLLIANNLEQPDADFMIAGSVVAVPGWFSRGAAALVGAAGQSWRVTFRAVLAQLELRDAGQVFADVAAATAAVMFRRRVYFGAADHTMSVPLRGYEALGMADRLAASLRSSDLAPDRVREATASCVVFDQFRPADPPPPETYDAMRLRFDEFD